MDDEIDFPHKEGRRVLAEAVEYGSRLDELLFHQEREKVAEYIIAKWNQNLNAGPVLLEKSHALIKTSALSEILFAWGVEFAKGCFSFPPRAQSGEFVFPSFYDADLTARARASVLHMLNIGELQACGRDTKAPLKIVSIPADAWGALEADFENSSAGTGEYRLLDVRVVRPTPPGRATAQVRVPVPLPKIRRWMEAKKAQGDSIKPDRDKLQAQIDLGGDIRRDHFRAVHKEVFGSKPRGRPPKGSVANP